MTEERRTPPARRKDESYEALDKKIDEKFDALTTRLSRFFRKALVSGMILGVTSTAGLLGFGLVTQEIQNQRYDSLINTCNEQNDHHNRAVAKGKELLSPEAQSTVILLVNELQPYVQDCKARARNRVKGG